MGSDTEKLCRCIGTLEASLDDAESKISMLEKMLTETQARAVEAEAKVKELEEAYAKLRAKWKANYRYEMVREIEMLRMQNAALRCYAERARRRRNK